MSNMNGNSKTIKSLPEDFEQYLVTEDRTDERDFIFEDHFDGELASGVSPTWDIDIMKIWNQYHQKATYKACTGYGLTGIYNGNNVKEYLKEGETFEQVDPKWMREPYQAMRGYPNEGSSLQNMLKFFIKMDWIEGYMRSDTEQGTKNALDNGFLIYTGSNRCDWGKTGASGIFVEKINGGGHAFFIVGYNDKGFIAVNSFGDNWGDKGYFIIPFENYNDLYSKNVVIDKDDTGILKNLKYENEFKKAIELGITNGLTPNDPVTRKQCAVMAYRASKINY